MEKTISRRQSQQGKHFYECNQSDPWKEDITATLRYFYGERDLFEDGVKAAVL